ncbi:hypothetical protein [Roseivirga sp.]|uniref:hypothetical protein n=1 Tax=Roseivirga sp. TaxID=1964215 RepID=UPI003B8D6082
MSPSRLLGPLLILLIQSGPVFSQSEYPDVYLEEDWLPKIDSLREVYGKKVSYKNKKGMELATLLAISHYPELQDRKLKIIIKNMKGAPVEASFGVFNFIKPRRSKVYKILIQENSFMERLTLNQQVAALGHEMAHFIQYEQRKYFGTLFTLLQYVMSDKYRLRFEKKADELAVQHRLGPQMLDFAFYSSDEQIRAYMNKLDND